MWYKGDMRVSPIKSLLSFGLAVVLTGGSIQAAEEKTTVKTPPVQLQTTPKFEIKPLEIPSQPASAAQPVPYQPTVIRAGLSVELVIDASGSMNGFLGTDSKINLVKETLKDLVSQWTRFKEPPLHFGLRTFGSKHPLEANECNDSELLFPIATLDPQAVIDGLKPIQAQGTNPLSLALQKAGEDLIAQNEDRVIILLTDGKDSCAQDPCVTAKNLYDRQKIITHVIAFDATQVDEPALQCIAGSSNGVFLLARTREELGAAIDEALRSTIPYNLRLKVLVGGTPLPGTVTVYKAGTQQIVERRQSFGIELLRLAPASYDILVEYSASVEQNKPSKILKGVELTQTGKVEQEIRFDLAAMTLSAHDAQGKPAGAEYSLFKTGTKNKAAAFTSDGTAATFYILPGNYDLIADKIAPAGQEMTFTEKNIAVSLEQGFLKDFAFQTGTIVLKGETSQKKAVALAYKVVKAGLPESVVAEGSVEKTGGKIDLPPGQYDILVEAVDESLPARPKGKVEKVAVDGGAIVEKMAVIVTGTLNLTAVKAENKPASVVFTIRDSDSGEEIAKLEAPTGKVMAVIAPGKYDVQAMLVSPLYKEGPSVDETGVEVVQEKAKEVTMRFALGTLKVLGRNTKEQRLNTTIEVYKGGTEELVAQGGPSNNWIELDLGAGNYDFKATDNDSVVAPKPFVWQRDVTIEAGALYVREMVFTNAKLRLIGRGTNNEIIPVEFKVYKYGTDRAFFSGTTGQDWQSFDIFPDSYYVEASYHDPDTSQVLKKWITLKVGENEFVERELRF